MSSTPPHSNSKIRSAGSKGEQRAALSTALQAFNRSQKRREARRSALGHAANILCSALKAKAPEPVWPEPRAPPAEPRRLLALRPQPKRTFFDSLIDKYDAKERSFIDLERYYKTFAQKSSFVPRYGLQKQPAESRRREAVDDGAFWLKKEAAFGPSFDVQSISQPLKYDKIVEHRKQL